MTLRFVYHYAETGGFDGDLLDAGPVGDVAAAAEGAGFDAVSFTDHPAPGARWLASGGHQSLDPFVALAFAAAATERLRLLTYLAVLPYRNPLLLAKSAASLDKLSGGRLTLGLGAGHLRRRIPVPRGGFRRAQRALRRSPGRAPRHWRGEPFDYQGRHFHARDAVARPRPVQDPIPIWIGGNAKLSRRRAAERAQGWMPMSGGAELAATARTPMLGSVAELAAATAELREQARAAGRSDAIDVVYSYHGDGIEEPTAEAERHREAFAELAEAGVTWVRGLGPHTQSRCDLRLSGSVRRHLPDRTPDVSGAPTAPGHRRCAVRSRSSCPSAGSGSPTGT
ncbi:TIGR03619 family F420-dependent LLM class oxidoreductase [Yinghuangia aomiensis]